MDVNIIDQLIQDHQSKAEAEAKAKADSRQAHLEAFERAALEKIKSDESLAWVLDGYGSHRVEWDGDTMKFQWVSSDETEDSLQVSPFGIRAHWARRLGDVDPSRLTLTLLVSLESHRYDWRTQETMGELLMKARGDYPEFKKWKISKQVEKILTDSSAHGNEYSHALLYQYNADEAKARSLHASLLAADPDNREKWDSSMSAWLKERDEHEALQRIEAETTALMESHFNASLVYLRECAEIRKKNAELVKAYQAVLDKPMPIYELTYALVAFDGDEKYLETNAVYVKSVGGKDNIFEHLDGEFVKYYHPVSLKKVAAVASRNRAYSNSYYVPGWGWDNGINVYYVEGTITPDEIKKDLAERGLLPYPAKPVTDGLDGYMEEAAFNRAAQVWSKESEDGS